MEGIGRGRLFIGALKLLSWANSDFSIAIISESVFRWGKEVDGLDFGSVQFFLVFDFSETPAFRRPLALCHFDALALCHFDRREKSCHRHRLRENSFPMQKVKISRSARNDRRGGARNDRRGETRKGYGQGNCLCQRK